MENHWLIKILPDEIIQRANRILDRNKTPLTAEEKTLLDKVLLVYELAMIDTWNSQEQNDFSRLSEKCFEIIRILPIPTNDTARARYVLKLLAYSYLANKWESGRRFIVEHHNLCRVKIDEKTPWNQMLFKKIYLSILHLIKKDPCRTIDVINQLRHDQQNYEEQYLTSLPDALRKNAAFELVSLYFLARAVEIAGYMMLNRKASMDELQYCLNRTVKYCDCSGSELCFILRLILAAVTKYTTIHNVINQCKNVNGLSQNKC